MRKTWRIQEFNTEHIAYMKMQLTQKSYLVSTTETNLAPPRPQPQTKKSQFNNDERRPTTNYGREFWVTSTVGLLTFWANSICIYIHTHTHKAMEVVNEVNELQRPHTASLDQTAGTEAYRDNRRRGILVKFCLRTTTLMKPKDVTEK